jgi:integrase
VDSSSRSGHRFRECPDQSAWRGEGCTPQTPPARLKPAGPFGDVEVRLLFRAPPSDPVTPRTDAGNRVPKASSRSSWSRPHTRVPRDRTALRRAPPSAGQVSRVLRTAVRTGMRRGEALGLHWAEVDLDAARIAVNRSLTLVKEELVWASLKTARSRRNLPLDPETVAVLPFASAPAARGAVERG